MISEGKQLDIMDSRTSASSASSAPAETESAVSHSSGQRPSYCNLFSTSGLYPPQCSFDEGVIKQLDLDCSDESSIASCATNQNIQNTDDEKLKTFLRIRPVPETASYYPVLQIKDENTVLASVCRRNALWQEGTKKQTEFKFSKILGPECGQSTVFEECVTPIIEKFMNRENCLIFSYGATNSGKTYTMQGHGTEYGIIPRTLDAIFSRIHDRQYKLGNIRPHLYQAFQHLNEQEVELLRDKRSRIITEANIKQELMNSYRLTSSSFSDGSRSSVELLAGGHLYDSTDQSALFPNPTLYSVWVSYAELYNERVYDLLDPSVVGKGRRRKELKLMQDRNGYVYVKDLTELPVTSDEEAYKVFLAGRKNLQFAATQMNQNSSRSHSFFTIRIVSVGIGDGVMPYPRTVHRMTFCDLAGMERANQTENKGFRLQESGNINNSLLVLLKVIRVLREKQMNNQGNVLLETVPFRESKLTHIFKSYFTSATHICMVVNVNPHPSVVESTLQVLQNSAIASNVIVFRQLENNVQLQQLSAEIENVNKVTRKPPLPPKGVTKGADHAGDKKRPLASTTEESGSDSDDYGVQTVVAPKTILQKLKLLEVENERLRRMLRKCEQEKLQIREEALKYVNEQTHGFTARIEKMKVTEENFHLRRLSLARQNQLSPSSRCGRCCPPVADMEDIEESVEVEEGDEQIDVDGGSDKEN